MVLHRKLWSGCFNLFLNTVPFYYFVGSKCISDGLLFRYPLYLYIGTLHEVRGVGQKTHSPITAQLTLQLPRTAEAMLFRNQGSVETAAAFQIAFLAKAAGSHNTFDRLRCRFPLAFAHHGCVIPI